MRFKIITAVWNAGRFFDRYVESIASQDYPNYDVFIVDDASTDGTAQKVEQACEQHGWQYRINDINRGALFNQVSAIRSSDCKPEDVLVFVDGDDRLAHDRVLERLEHYYSDGTLLTYGQYRPDPPSRTCSLAGPYPQHIWDSRDFRGSSARGEGIWWNHLRTFKYEVFQHLTDDDFLDANGDWYKTATDAVLMYPCIELAWPHVKFIDEVLYIYTSDNNISDWRRWPRQCDRDHEHVLSKPPKEPLRP